MKLWQELRRRRVFRLAGLYVVGAWLAIQVADISFPAWELPETAIRYLFIAALACFPIAIFFSWHYDVTAQGIVRTKPTREGEVVDLSLKRGDFVILAALSVITIIIVTGSMVGIRQEIETGDDVAADLEKSATSIAVLPFTNLDPRSDTIYFSDGVTEEILHQLSMIGAVQVLASTSSFAFRNSDESPAAISDRLGVRYLLQGSVRRDGDYVRVTARLLDESGFQVWSDRFDRKLEKIFVIQAEIARKVSSEVVNEIVPPLELPEGRTTENMIAYNAYLQGRAYLESRSGNWREEARKAFDLATDLDPGFAPPYAGKAALVVNSGFGPHWEEARDFALKSLELDPDLPLGHATLGLTLAVLGDNERAVESLQKSIELNPSLAIAYNWITMPLSALGQDEDAKAMRERGLEIDPLNPVLLRNMAGLTSFGGNFDRAEQLLHRLTALPDVPWWIYMELGVLYTDWGRYADAVESAKDDVRLTSAHGSDLRLEDVALGYVAVGLFEQAEYWFELSRDIWQEREPPMHSVYFIAAQGARFGQIFADLETAESMVAMGDSYDTTYLLTYGGLAWTYLGQAPKGVEWLERGVAADLQIEPDKVASDVDYSLLKIHWGSANTVLLAQRLAFAYRITGNEGGIEHALRFLEQEMTSAQLPTNPASLESFALTAVLLGDTDAALAHLRQALKLGWANYYGVVNDPAWAKTLELPEFQAVLAEAKANNDRQRAIVDAADAKQDFRAEFQRQLSTAAEAR